MNKPTAAELRQPASFPAGHSMVSRLELVLVCSPRNATWNKPERIALWTQLGFLHAPDFERAQAEHQDLCRELEGAGAEVLELPQSSDLSLDAIYVHDASFATDFGLIVLRPGKKTRESEGGHHRSLCQNLGIPIFAEMAAPATAEAGDMVWLDSGTLLIGHGYRTNSAGIEQMRAMLAPRGIDVIAAPLPYGQGPSACLHLMSLVSLLDPTTALVDLPWLAVETVALLKARGYRLIEIDYSERDSLACNVLALDERRLLAFRENENTNRKLQDAGFDLRTFAGTELGINGGGGPTCLTRPLKRG
jgi:N-dimethylarginine dimethylaminohydrolase